MRETVQSVISSRPLISLNRDKRAFGEKVRGGISMDWVDVT
ncbi:hypothetical protein [Bradyrhizobium sp. C9]|nr:hypothetical protein [Bradyrhizobium sp. C9]